MLVKAATVSNNNESKHQEHWVVTFIQNKYCICGFCSFDCKSALYTSFFYIFLWQRHNPVATQTSVAYVNSLHSAPTRTCIASYKSLMETMSISSTSLKDQHASNVYDIDENTTRDTIPFGGICWWIHRTFRLVMWSFDYTVAVSLNKLWIDNQTFQR